jgi:choloylglycine hydrolase
MWAEGGRVLVGRNVDWYDNPKTDLWVMPRGVQRKGSVAGKGMEWTSKYGSVVGVAWDSVVNAGLNEAGLTANCLWLATGDHGKRDESVPGLSEAEWAQFYLDRFATVKEAVEWTEQNPMQVRGCRLGPVLSLQHLTIQDATGDSAVIEYVGGKLQTYHDRRFIIVTNEPTYDEQLRNIRQYKGFGGEKPLPGSTEAADRFVRGAYYVRNLPEMKTDREAVAGILSVMKSMSQPFTRASSDRPNVSATVYTVAFDLGRRAVYFEATTSPYPIWLFMKDFDLSEGRPALKLADVSTVDRMGDVAKSFVETAPFRFAPGE